jgi:Glycosyltransferase family 87
LQAKCRLGNFVEFRKILTFATKSSSDLLSSVHCWQRQVTLGLLPLLAGIGLLAGTVFVPQALRGNADFRQFYAGGYMIRVGMRHQLYDLHAQREVENRVVASAAQLLPINHPAYEYLFFAPLAWLTYRQAYTVWMTINVIILTFCGVKMAQMLDDGWLALSLFAGFGPVWATIMQGQDSIWVLFFLVLSLRSTNEFSSGVFLGLTAFRFHLLIPVLVLYALWKCWRFLQGALLAGTALAALSVWLVGLDGSMLYIKSAVVLTTLTKSFPVSIYGLMEAIAGPRHTTSAMIGACTCAIIALVYAARRKPSLDVALLVVPLASYYLLLHELVILLIPIGLRLRKNSAAIIQFVAPILGFSPLSSLSSAPAGLMLFRSDPNRTLDHLSIVASGSSEKTISDNSLLS